MDLMEIRRNMMGVLAMANSKGLRYAAGTIEIASQTNTPPTVTHNLGTKKVMGIWWKEDGSVISTYNRFAWQSVINWWDIIPDDYSITVNNTTEIQFDKTKGVPQPTLVANNSAISPQAQTLAADGFDITNDTWQLKGGYYTIWDAGTYHWLVIALDDALNDAMNS